MLAPFKMASPAHGTARPTENKEVKNAGPMMVANVKEYWNAAR